MDDILFSDTISPPPADITSFIDDLTFLNTDSTSCQTDISLPVNALVQIIIPPTSSVTMEPEDNPPIPKAPPNPQQPNQSETTPTRSWKRKRFCNYCKRHGHVIEECRTRERNNKRRMLQKRKSTDTPQSSEQS